ncbi:Vitamin K epoxide reductase family [Seminavis robusta]|uniref:Vitamin K epoxide reductase family n=1 Tax=Seminavis robusta TaxID=568900 RepID=A0A9N8HHB3_9STRA|nr:Vitamin K epoxide reductase family [Seminavis robusta]|eukprot:Sro695_g188670.1 Vitamin K epoxide reductase family (297) ;mRNA; f:19551-20525
MASLGALETAYLTVTKVTGASQAFCGPDGGCNSVLSGPYASIPFTDFPLAALGLVAYSMVATLALLPIATNDSDDTENRIWLAAATTTMGTFSIFLMSLLFGVLHESCPFCIVSACLSIGMAGIFWVGGGLPDEERKRGAQISVGSFATTFVAALTLFLSVDDTSTATQFAGSAGGSAAESGTLLASAEGYKPPPITTVSSERTLALSAELGTLNAKLYGAYWCSHCYDQKEAFGKQAFSTIQYIECSKDGYNQQNGLCKEKNVPGYPTWEINGKLYPGEQAIEELEEIVLQAKKN